MKRQIIVENVKKDKLFKKGDIIIYISLLLIIVLLFVFFVFNTDNKELTTINIIDTSEKNENIIFTYNVKKGEYDVFSEDVKIRVEESQLYIEVIDEDEINIVIIEKNGKTYVEDANCSKRMDCVHTKAITKGGEVIVCVPNNLMIEGVGNVAPDITIG